MHYYYLRCTVVDSCLVYDILEFSGVIVVFCNAGLWLCQVDLLDKMMAVVNSDYDEWYLIVWLHDIGWVLYFIFGWQSINLLIDNLILIIIGLAIIWVWVLVLWVWITYWTLVVVWCGWVFIIWTWVCVWIVAILSTYFTLSSVVNCNSFTIVVVPSI